MRVAIVGATGAVGAELIALLEPLDVELQVYASPRSEGRKLSFAGKELTVRATPRTAIDADVVLASAGASVSREWAHIWSEKGAVIIDNSSAFRLEEGVPLVVPEVNGEAALLHQGIIANPNCTTAIAAVAVAPLHRRYGIERMIVSTYQATSGAGQKGMDELREQTMIALQGGEVTHQEFVHPIPFNVIPHIDVFLENGYTKEEMKVVLETRKILNDDSLAISCTAVRIPTLRTHSEAITLQLRSPASPEEVRELLQSADGVEVRDNPAEKLYPMPLTASGKHRVEVGRIRQSLVFDGGIDLFVAGDQLLKGAALNAVQIAQYLREKGQFS